MTRVAIVAASDALRRRLAQALAADPSFEVVSVSESALDGAPAADVVLVAQDPSDDQRTSDAVPVEARGEERVLSARERQILALLADGLPNKQIASRLGISTNTVKTHLELLFDKLGVSSRAEAVAKGVRRGLLML